MARQIEIETRVCGGFPILARGYACPAEPDVGIFSPYVEDADILTVNGRPAKFIADKMTADDWDAVMASLNGAI